MSKAHLILHIWLSIFSLFSYWMTNVQLLMLLRSLLGNRLSGQIPTEIGDIDGLEEL